MGLTEEQKRMRATGFGASEIATIVGVSPGNLGELWESKVNPRLDAPTNLAMKLGNVLEDGVAKIYAEETKTLLAPATTFRHPTRPHILATPDRARFMSQTSLDAARALGVNELGQLTNLEAFQHADRGVEVKTHAARYRKDYGEAGSGLVPEHEAVQVTVQMGVLGLRIVDVPVLFRGDWGVDMHTFTVTFNEDLFGWLCDEADKFWRDYVEAKKPPPADGSEQYGKVLERLYSKSSKALLTAEPADEELILRWAKLQAVEKRAAHYKALAGQQLAQRIGGAGGLLSATLGKLSWISVAPSTYVDWHKAATDFETLGGLVLNNMRTLAAKDEKPSDASFTELEARLKAIVPEATKPKNGYRYLKMTPQGDAKLDLARLEVALDALEGDNPSSTNNGDAHG